MKKMKSYSCPNHTWYNEGEYNVLYLNELDPLVCNGKHNWETSSMGTCFIKRVCLNCGAVYELDSSD